MCVVSGCSPGLHCWHNASCLYLIGALGKPSPHHSHFPGVTIDPLYPQGSSEASPLSDLIVAAPPCSFLHSSSLTVVAPGSSPLKTTILSQNLCLKNTQLRRSHRKVSLFSFNCSSHGLSLRSPLEHRSILTTHPGMAGRGGIPVWVTQTDKSCRRWMLLL